MEFPDIALLRSAEVQHHMPSHHRRRRRSSSSGSQSRHATTAARAQPMDAGNLWLVVAGAYWVMMVLAMHLPGHSIPPELRPDGGTDGVLHCLAYTGFSFLVCRAFDALHRRRYPALNPPMLVYFFIFLACITYGYIDEETQPLTGRTADLADWEADVLGSLFGVCLHLFMNIFLGSDPAQMVLDRMRRRHRRSRRHRSHRHSSRSAGEHKSSEEQASSPGESEKRRSRRRRRSHRRGAAPDDPGYDPPGSGEPGPT